MKIPLEIIRKMLIKYSGEFNVEYLNYITAGDKELRAGKKLLIDDIQYLDKANIREIDVIYNVTLYDYLNAEYPVDYRKPYRRADFIELDKYFDVLNKINTISKRRRFVNMVGDLYSVDDYYRRTIVIGHNEEVDYKKWNSVKRQIDKDQTFFYRNSENGIILFVNLMDKQDKNYIDKFKRNTDLIAAMVTKRKDKHIEIAPDFIETEDVTSVTEPDLLLDEYIKTGARLIVIGENIDESYKKVLLKVKKYDRFVRFLAVPMLDTVNTDRFLLQVKQVYNKDRWSE